MGIRDRVVFFFNASLAGIFVAGSLILLAWFALMFGGQIATWHQAQLWVSLPVNELLRPQPVQSESWALYFVPALGKIASDPESLITWSFAQQALGWFGRVPLTALALAGATVMAWISSDLRVENMRLRARAERAQREAALERLPDDATTIFGQIA
ncbi:MAG TPA: hypothetical protein PKA20_24970 [Burkholderiaceae bacterium]|nr:hypothetical protein [Burkholderiaceae bacterium]